MTKNYDQILYEILKPLAVKHHAKLYLNAVVSDYDSQPEDYVIYSTGMSNLPKTFGDGKVILRKCSCDITVNEAGTGNGDNSGYLVALVEELLIQHNIPYQKINLGYIESSDSMQTTFDFYLI